MSNDRVKIGLVGSQFVSSIHARALRTVHDAEIVAVVGRVEIILDDPVARRGTVAEIAVFERVSPAPSGGGLVAPVPDGVAGDNHRPGRPGALLRARDGAVMINLSALGEQKMTAGHDLGRSHLDCCVLGQAEHL